MENMRHIPLAEMNEHEVDERLKLYGADASGLNAPMNVADWRRVDGLLDRKLELKEEKKCRGGAGSSS